MSIKFNYNNLVFGQILDLKLVQSMAYDISLKSQQRHDQAFDVQLLDKHYFSLQGSHLIEFALTLQK